MTTPAVGIHQAMQSRAAREREGEQHRPRPARIRFAVRTHGIGESRLQHKKAIRFGAYMLEEPSFSWGVEALDHLVNGDLPFCTATVLRYLKNKHGLYTGAEMGFAVYSNRINIRLKFSLTFEGSTLRSTVGTEPTTLDATHTLQSYTIFKV